jgi:hypothetical protein
MAGPGRRGDNRGGLATADASSSETRAVARLPAQPSPSYASCSTPMSTPNPIRAVPASHFVLSPVLSEMQAPSRNPSWETRKGLEAEDDREPDRQVERADREPHREFVEADRDADRRGPRRVRSRVGPLGGCRPRRERASTPRQTPARRSRRSRPRSRRLLRPHARARAQRTASPSRSPPSRSRYELGRAFCGCYIPSAAETSNVSRTKRSSLSTLARGYASSEPAGGYSM